MDEAINVNPWGYLPTQIYVYFRLVMTQCLSLMEWGITYSHTLHVLMFQSLLDGMLSYGLQLN